MGILAAVSDYDPEVMLADVRRREARDAERRRVLDELGGQRFTGTSASGHVTVQVDGSGGLLDIKVADNALRQAHPTRIGPDTVEAIGAARAAVGLAYAERSGGVV